MAVFRIEKTRDYTVMSNYHLRDICMLGNTQLNKSWRLCLFLPEMTQPMRWHIISLKTN